MTEFILFKNEIVYLRDLLSDKKIKLDDESREIIKTMYELITKYSIAVKNIDLEDMALREFMSRKAELFYRNYRNKSKDYSIIIKKKPADIYNLCSISLKKGGIVLLYPYILIAVINYQNSIRIFCRRTRKKTKLNFDSIIDVLYDLSLRLKPRLLKWDVSLIRKLVKTCQLPENYPRVFLKYRSNKRFKRLQNLRVLGFYYAINFTSIGLVPYMHLSHHKTEIPEELKPYIEFESHPSKKTRGYQLFRLFLFPEAEKKEFYEKLANIGLTSEVEEWYCKYNFDDLIQTKSGTWKWKINLLTPSPRYDSGKYVYMINTEESIDLKPKFLSYLEAVHQMSVINAEEIRIDTGISPHSIKRYQKMAIERKFILPDLYISRIGLNAYLQICLVSKEHQDIIRLFETLPKIKVIKSRAFSRYLINIPRSNLKEIIKIAVGEGILDRTSISLVERSIERGVKLTAIL
ncbi:MAG: hypothetical protein ACTSP4_07500 [Candidatus Hodarchaeales archaeon]